MCFQGRSRTLSEVPSSSSRSSPPELHTRGRRTSELRHPSSCRSRSWSTNVFKLQNACRMPAACLHMTVAGILMALALMFSSGLRQGMQHLELNNIERRLLLRQGILRRIRPGSRSHLLKFTLRTAALPDTVLLLNPARPSTRPSARVSSPTMSGVWAKCARSER